MNILIPLGGYGLRFKNAGYHIPKPLIPALGKPILYWLLDSLVVSSQDVVYICYRQELDAFAFQSTLQRRYPTMNLVMRALETQTHGAAETLYYMLHCMVTTERLDKPCMSLDGDTFYHCNVIQHGRRMLTGNVSAAVLSFHTDELEPLYSYVQPIHDDGAQNGRIKAIAEKVKISSLANTGCYMFRRSGEVLSMCRHLLAHFKPSERCKEPYVSLLIQLYLERQLPVHYQLIHDTEFCVIGTPLQLQVFCEKSRGGIKQGDKKRFCFDIDNTLLIRAADDTDYTNVSPVHHVIRYLQNLHEQGHTIILYTARRMRTHRGNIGAVIQDIAQTTIESLSRHKIPYDELVFGKPYAHVYIDDLAVNPCTQDLEKHTGFYFAKAKERHFNHVSTETVSAVVKTSEDSITLSGEIYWYQHMPPGIQHLFPQFLGTIPHGYRMVAIEGIPLSYLLLKNAFQSHHLQLLLRALDTIHACPVEDDESQEINIYANYATKVRTRMQTHSDVYRALGDDVLEEGASLVRELEVYEGQGQGKRCVVHGDPVLSNVLLLKEETRVQLIDMRGRQHTTLTLLGDMHYDWAKVYQCLLGYDQVLHGQTPVKAAPPSLIRAFCNHIGEAAAKYIPLLTRSLIYSLIPLHVSRLHRDLYGFYKKCITDIH